MNDSLAILIIVKSLPWRYKGGIQTHAWDLAKALYAKGHQVTLLTGGAFLSKEIHSDQDGIRIIEVPFFPGRYLPAVSFLAEELAFNLRVKGWVSKHHHSFNIIHAQGRSGYLLYQLPQIHDKLVQTIHGHTGVEAASDGQNLNAKIHAFFAQKWEKNSLSTLRKTIAVSKDLMQAMVKSRKISTQSIAVIPNGVAFDETGPHAVSSEQTVDRFVFVGRLHPVKGLIPLIQQIAKAPKKVYLDIIGEGSQRRELEKVIADLNLAKQVRLLGAFDNSAVQLLLPHYLGLVLPSLYESQGIVLLEANLRSIPVIASDLPAIRESITHGENGLLCSLSRPEEFTEAMIFLQENRSLAKQMGKSGEKRVREQYSWSKIADQTIALYHQLAS
jgi:glycosyltransferase involved in cell wall biosynthesis